MEKLFKNIAKEIEKMAKALSQEREIAYPEDTFASASSLLYCPLKWELRRQHPDVEYTNLDIQEGFFWEERVKRALLNVFGERVSIEPEVSTIVNGKRIVAHPDAVIHGKNKDLILELKAPKYLRVLGNVPVEEDGLVVIKGNEVDIPEHYILQNRIQQFIWKKEKRDCFGALFIFTSTKKDGKMHRIQVAKIVSDPITEEEMKQLVKEFEENKGPRFAWECSYCKWKELGYCEGKPFQQEDKTRREFELPPEVEQAVQEIYSLKNRIKDLEHFLKNVIPYGTKYIRNGKVVGWEPKKKRVWNTEKLVDKVLSLPDARKVLSEAFYPKKNAYDLLYRLLEDEVDTLYSIEEEMVFKY